MYRHSGGRVSGSLWANADVKEVKNSPGGNRGTMVSKNDDHCDKSDSLLGAPVYEIFLCVKSIRKTVI